jgi:hypothetical protein
MTRRPFNAAAFLAGYRAACIEADFDPLTGNPNACADPLWWARDPALWNDPGPAHSSVEAEALASIAAQVRRIAGVPDAEAPGADYAIRPSVRAEIASLAEDGAGRLVQGVLPLRDIHRRQGVVVEEVLGVRLIVPIKVA